MFTRSPLPPQFTPPIESVSVLVAPTEGQYSGTLVESIEETVAKAEGGAAPARPKPTLLHKQDGRNYFRLTELPAHVELHCATAGCANNAHVLADSRHGEVLPYCKDCAHVEFAMWMVGV